ncbi:TonB-dependent receptor [Aestuariibacter sp. AA17]|uniref:TonB-dependent receptor n=1 Tax=Fluctibacter corallii TaxID=2984329 RepID=A0ABT3AC86_9ALTE|nr:TonB-dependent receptor [Aestuariibacter sp. AA17]MCV2886298.1 TonB-dependent receptor [Aestuariibacter sp. AA17]
MIKLATSLPIVVSILTTSLSHPSFANDNMLETITITASRSDKPLHDVNHNISLIDEQLLSLFNHEHINQIMFNTPGAWISRGNGQEHLTAIRSPVLTGAGSCGAFYVAQDGISLRGPAFCNANQLFDSHSEAARRIEVIRGASGVEYGSNAVHGVINILSPSPLTSSSSNIANITLGPDEFVKAALSLKHLNDNSATQLDTHFSEDSGFQDSSGYEQQKISLIHENTNEDTHFKWVLSATNLNQETAGFIQGPLAYKDDGLQTQNPNPEAYRDTQSARLYGIITHSLNETMQFTISPYVRWTDMQFLQHYLPWKATEENSQLGGGVKSTITLNSNALKTTLGLDIDVTQGALLEFQDEPFSPSIPVGVHYDYDVTVQQYSPFSLVEYSLSEALTISGGIRYEYMYFDYENKTDTLSACEPSVTSCRFYRPDDQTRSFNNWSWQIGGRYVVSESVIAFTRINQGYRAPQATELFRLQAGQQSAELNSERINAFEVGVRGKLADIDFELTSFVMEKSHFIFQDTQRQNISNGETRHHGLELHASQMRDSGTYWRVNGTLAKHRYDNSLMLSRTVINGNEIDTAPEHIASVALGKKWKHGHTFELEWLHMGNYYLNPENTAEYAGHNVFNLRSTLRIAPELNLHLSVLNLLDKDYAERADFAFGNERYFVGEPRSLFVGIQWQW